MKPFSVLFPPNFETQFRAIGMLKGIISEIDSNQATLSVGEGEVYPIRIGGTFRDKILKKPQLKDELPGKEMLWKGYPRTNFQGELLSFQLINFYFPDSTLLEEVDYFSIRGLIEQISTDKKNIQVQIKSNFSTYNSRAFIVALFGEQPKALPGQFWEFLAKRDGASLVVESGKFITAAYDREQAVILNHSSQKSSKKQEVKEVKVTPNQTKIIDNLIMIPGKTPEITVKFSTRPELPEQGQKVTLQVNGENGISVRTTLNRKTLKKQVEKMDSFTEWVGVLTGKMLQIAPDGVLEIEGASVTVFEKKFKATETESKSET